MTQRISLPDNDYFKIKPQETEFLQLNKPCAMELEIDCNNALESQGTIYQQKPINLGAKSKRLFGGSKNIKSILSNISRSFNQSSNSLQSNNSQLTSNIDNHQSRNNQVNDTPSNEIISSHYENQIESNKVNSSVYMSFSEENNSQQNNNGKKLLIDNEVQSQSRTQNTLRCKVAEDLIMHSMQKKLSKTNYFTQPLENIINSYSKNKALSKSQSNKFQCYSQFAIRYKSPSPIQGKFKYKTQQITKNN